MRRAWVQSVQDFGGRPTPLPPIFSLPILRSGSPPDSQRPLTPPFEGDPGGIWRDGGHSANGASEMWGARRAYSEWVFASRHGCFCSEWEQCHSERILAFRNDTVIFGIRFSLRDGSCNPQNGFALDILRGWLAGGFAFGSATFGGPKRAWRRAVQHASPCGYGAPLKKWSRPTGLYPNGLARKDKWFGNLRE